MPEPEIHVLRPLPQEWTFFQAGVIPELVSTAFSLTVAPNGDVWVGSVNSVSKFDGSTSTLYPFTDPIAQRNSEMAFGPLAIDTENTLWAEFRAELEGKFLRFIVLTVRMANREQKY